MEILNSRGIIFAADIPDEKRLLKTVEEVAPYVEAIKLGNVVFWEHGLRVIQLVKQRTEKPIIADLKFMDIPHMAELAAARVLSSGGDGIMISGPSGGDVMSACKTVLGDRMVFVFTQFTHETGLIADEMADEYIDLALTVGGTGIQVPNSA